MNFDIIETFIENLPIGIFIKNKNFKIITCNKIACDIFSIKKEEILNKKLIDITHLKENNNIIDEIKKFENEILSGINNNIQNLLLKINNENLHIQINRFCCKINNEKIIICSIINNTNIINEKNQLYTEINTIIRYLDEILYSITHDFKKPISIIKIFTQMILENISNNILENDTTKEIYQNLMIINTTINLLEKLVDDLFEYSTILNHDITYIDIDLDALFNNILEEFQDKIEKYNISVNIGYLPIIKSNELYMKKVFINLINNSIEFRDKNRTLNININTKISNDYWEIIYSDNGIGFNPKHNQDIFGLFKKLNNKKNSSGTGVGLAITKKIIEAHGGTISAEGYPNIGATFIIKIPRKNIINKPIIFTRNLL